MPSTPQATASRPSYRAHRLFLYASGGNCGLAVLALYAAAWVELGVLGLLGVQALMGLYGFFSSRPDSLRTGDLARHRRGMAVLYGLCPAIGAFSLVCTILEPVFLALETLTGLDKRPDHEFGVAKVGDLFVVVMHFGANPFGRPYACCAHLDEAEARDHAAALAAAAGAHLVEGNYPIDVTITPAGARALLERTDRRADEARRQ